MPQVIEVPGHGPVEFPDGMSDDQIVAAIKKNAMVPQQKSKLNPEQAAQFQAVMTQGWGTGVPKAIYDIGGRVTDVTGSPAAGAATGFLLNAIPAFLTLVREGRAPTPPASIVHAASRRERARELATILAEATKA